jgi:hypothetical protein
VLELDAVGPEVLGEQACQIEVVVHQKRPHVREGSAPFRSDDRAEHAENVTGTRVKGARGSAKFRKGASRRVASR